MITFLMRQGIEERDYTKAIVQWEALVKAVGEEARIEEDDAIAHVLAAAATTQASGSTSTSTSSTLATTHKKEAAQLAAEKTEAEKKTKVGTMLTRVRKAYGYLFAALPPDVRLLVADVPQGYAFGIWSFLEKKYRNTEQDSIAALWSNFLSLVQSAEENFDEYKARVDSVVELLTLAKDKPSDGLYSTLLLWRLQPRYETAVLTLKTGDRVKDPSKIDWPAIVEYMGQYERSQQALTGVDGASDRAMAARGSRPPSSSKSTSALAANAKPGSSRSSQSSTSSVQCWNCQEMGHFASKCPRPNPRRQKPKRGDRSSGKGGTNKPSWPGSKTSSEDETEHPKQKRANMMRSTNCYDSLNDDGVSEEIKHQRSYAAVLMAGSLATKKSPTPASTEDLDLDTALRTVYKAVDTAATVSTSCTLEALENVRRCAPMPIKMANGSVLSAMYKGDLKLRLPEAGKGAHFVVTIPDVYYHERFDANLLSWGVMKSLGWDLHSRKKRTYLVTPDGKETNAISKSNLTLLKDTTSARVYGITGAMSTSPIRSFVCKTAKEVVQLHRRLGHVSWTRLVEMSKSGTSVGMPDLTQMSKVEREKARESIQECSACLAAKAHRKPLGQHGLDKGQRPGDVLHMDNFYITTRNPTTGEKRTQYCLLAVDAYTEWRWFDARTRKSNLAQAAIDIIQHCHTMSGRYPRLVISDLGSEFDNHLLEAFARKCGFRVQPSPARAKELNGLAEKNGDTAKKHVLAMMHGAKMEPEFGWTHAIQHFVYVWNRSHVGQHTQTTPYQAMTGREASVLNIGEFGCDVFVHQHRSTRDVTFSAKSQPAIYLGHDGRMNCPRVRMLHSGKIILSKDVHFREGRFTHLHATMKGREAQVPPLEIRAAESDEIFSPTVTSSESAGSSSNWSEQKYPEEKKYPDPSDSHVDQASNDSDDVDEQYELKGITDSRVQDGTKQYRCKWIGYSTQTWEPADSIRTDAPKVVEAYEKFIANREQARTTRSRSAAAASRSSAAAAALASSSDADNEDDSDSSSSSAIESAAAYAARCL